MEHIQSTFSRCKADGRAALVTYVTAGYPSIQETPDIMLAMQEGGSDIIELGIPFTDPIADGKTIQMSNLQALANGVTISSMLEMVKTARQKGLHVPVVFMGYYNPILQYGSDEKLLDDCKAAGVSGFIIVDLPPEEALRFRNQCRRVGLSYIPLIAPSTADDRMKMLCEIADSFIYVVSRMGVTGASVSLSDTLPALLERIHVYSENRVPTAVGFGISTREHFLSVARIAEGVVIGSQIISVIKDAAAGDAAKSVKKYCSAITQRSPSSKSNTLTSPTATTTLTPTATSIALPDLLDMHGRFGQFGGQYVPEVLMQCLTELEAGFNAAKADPAFWAELRSFYPYIGRESSLHLASRLTEHAGGANIWLKREDLNHTGSHKINNALGQILLARRLGKTAIIAETGAGQHGVATATLCAKFGMKCTIFMGAEDVRRQALNVFRIRLLGATVIPVETGSRTLRDAVNEAFRTWVVDLQTTHFIVGSAFGPHPYPTIVRTFQSVIGDETRAQFSAMHAGRLPDAVVACVGGGSNATGMFAAFADDPSVAMVGVEAGGDGVDTPRHAATLSRGSVGVLHGVRTYVLQDEHGQIRETHSLSAGLDYPGVGPELAHWKDSGRARFIAVDDREALAGFCLLSRLEGIIPALESAHAVAGVVKVAREMPKGQNVVLCLSGRGDKDVETVSKVLPSFNLSEFDI
ncbi:hypothetical protein ASPZODRAFT_63606 [Penicilliopsis zonata CBS 506.65]|uniref:Tryptophan synthase n=1 Tax=Penicilliopsis zonata CBS 506.65 TaxID=1073090 RepID=A0A1L9SL37_9EURO|nr:hypothetical protein ASPZODRAFT_63606 [Penicilliopsis zonata CBS 506.65]OJJ47982.1 hypothetical protein ASPZODRAFT_63606 [Penicilliopsis zonata CBS 506.65]